MSEKSHSLSLAGATDQLIRFSLADYILLPRASVLAGLFRPCLRCRTRCFDGNSPAFLWCELRGPGRATDAAKFAGRFGPPLHSYGFG